MRVTASAVARRRQAISTGSGLLVGGLAYVLTLLQYGHDLTRTALAPGYFSGFFDLQGRAILRGHLAVPAGSLGFEGFVHGGHTYTYFPPWPAVLRLPVLMTTHEYDGRLTLVSMALAWVVLAVMTSKLIWLLLREVAGAVEPTRTTAVIAAIFLAGATGGTTLTYDASLPWVYHEVYLWAVAAAVGGLYWMVRMLYAPDRQAAWWLLCFSLVAVGSRVTEGWVLCLGTIVLGVSLRLRRRPAPPGLWWRTVLAGVVPLVVSIAVNEAKFGSVYLFPLQDQVFTQLNHHRRVALAANGGKLAGAQFFWTSTVAYLWPGGIRFVDYFPFVTLPAHPVSARNGVVIDQTYRTGSATAFMPLFMVLELVSLVACFWPRARPEMQVLRGPLLASVVITAGVMDYGYYANRYTSEFVPALVLGAAVGCALLARVVDGRRIWRGTLLVVLAVGTTFSILAQMATGLTMAATEHRGPLLVRYVGLQHRLTPGALAARTFEVDGLPQGGSTDDLAIRGDCQAVYLNTGDRYEPWVTVEERDLALHFDYDIDELEPGNATVLRLTTATQARVDVQVNNQRRMRFVIYDGARVDLGQWFDPPTTGGVGLGVRDRPDYRAYVIEATPGGVVGVLPSVYVVDEQDTLASQLAVADDGTDRTALAALGLRMSSRPGFPLALCQSLARSAGLDLGSR